MARLGQTPDISIYQCCGDWLRPCSPPGVWPGAVWAWCSPRGVAQASVGGRLGQTPAIEIFIFWVAIAFVVPTAGSLTRRGIISATFSA